MFDRKKYKKFALMQLKGRWIVPVLITFITALILCLLQSSDIKETWQKLSTLSMDSIFTKDSETLITSDNFTPKFSTYSTLHTFIGWIATFVEFVLIFAQCKLYILMSRGPEKVSMADFLDGLTLWSKAILCGIWKTVWICLWSLLFFFPGIIKYYAYSQMEYLLIEYPTLSITKAMRVSIEITKGHKADLFLMDLSFLGWAILATIPAGIGFFWLTPYISMAKTNAYHGLLKDAVSQGLIKPEDLEN